ncbi:MAG: LmeA family phospholipid-binding protein [Fimbriimonadales bacterium]
MERRWLAVIAILLTLGRGAVREWEKTAERELQSVIGGKVDLRIQPDEDGLFQGRLKRLVVDAREFALNGFPFTLEPERPRTGHIQKFILQMRSARLRGLRAESAYAEIPDVYYDRQLALSKRIFRLSATGIGNAVIVVNEDDLADYIVRKYAPYLREISVAITPEQTTVQGQAVFFGNRVQFRAVGKLAPREGVYLDLAEAQLEIEGGELPPQSVEILRQWLNPIIDLDRDLGIYDGLRVDAVLSEVGRMRVLGKIWIPQPRGQ